MQQPPLDPRPFFIERGSTVRVPKLLLARPFRLFAFSFSGRGEVSERRRVTEGVSVFHRGYNTGA